MIIYAFFGLGKSYYCKTHSDGFDADYHYFRFSEIATQMSYSEYVLEKSKQYRYVFVNSPTEETHFPIDIAFLPETIDFIIERLQKRKQGNFVPTIEMLKEDNRRFPNAILCKKAYPFEQREKEHYISNLMEGFTMMNEEKRIESLKQDIFLNPNMHKIRIEEYAPYSTGICYYGNYREEDKKVKVLKFSDSSKSKIDKIVTAIYQQCYIGASDELFQEMNRLNRKREKSKSYLSNLLKEDSSPFSKTRFYGSYGLSQLDAEAEIWEQTIKDKISQLNKEQNSNGLGGVKPYPIVKEVIKECEKQFHQSSIFKKDELLKYQCICHTFLNHVKNVPDGYYLPNYGVYRSNSPRVDIDSIMEDFREIANHFHFAFGEISHPYKIGNNHLQVVTYQNSIVCNQVYVSGIYSDGHFNIQNKDGTVIASTKYDFHAKGDRYDQIFDNDKGNIPYIPITVSGDPELALHQLYETTVEAEESLERE